jgi:hypothetical protein
MGIATGWIEPRPGTVGGPTELALQIAVGPTAFAMRSRPALGLSEPWDLEFENAIAQRKRNAGGREIIASGETRRGQHRFAAGAGRHGSFTLGTRC